MKPGHYISVLIIFPVLLVQLTVIPLISVNEIAPDLIVITVVYCSIAFGQVFGTIYGAYCGLVLDLIAGNLLGSSMLSKTLAGFTAGYFSSETRREQYLYTYSFTAVVLICSLIDETIFSFFSVVDFQTNILKVLFDHALLPSIYSAVISILLVIVPHKRSYT
jgi:rod shape-determining protein MreD